MDDFNQNNGELNGFDKVENNGYTVTPEGGFYSKPKEDIIQDDFSKEDYTSRPPANHTPYYSFNNNGCTPKKPNKKKGKNIAVVALCCVLSAVVGAASGIIAVKLSGNTETVVYKQSELSGTNVNINVDEEASSVVEAVAQKVTPSVVGIRTTTSVTSFFGNQESSGEGSGVIYRTDGYIITNYHVISDAISNKSNSKIEVFLENSTSESYSATVVGYNISADLAVIKINVTGLPAIEIADSSKLKVGQYAITVGNPGGLEFMDSVTYGVISGLDRVVSSDSTVALIQTDAAINPGNSGGALVNTSGKLIGINSSKIASVDYEGMGFAIPSNTVVELCDKIIDNENSPEPYIGITVSEKYTADVLKYYGYPNGAVVLSVADNSPAYNAGIRKGDIITEFSGSEIKEYTELEELMSKCEPGDKITVKLYRSKRYYSTTITVGSNN